MGITHKKKVSSNHLLCARYFHIHKFPFYHFPTRKIVGASMKTADVNQSLCIQYLLKYLIPDIIFILSKILKP
jgi:hypothetical protein